MVSVWRGNHVCGCLVRLRGRAVAVELEFETPEACDLFDALRSRS